MKMGVLFTKARIAKRKKIFKSTVRVGMWKYVKQQGCRKIGQRFQDQRRPILWTHSILRYEKKDRCPFYMAQTYLRGFFLFDCMRLITAPIPSPLKETAAPARAVPNSGKFTLPNVTILAALNVAYSASI